MKIGIVGLGYVGLPLALQFARKGVDVTGLDIDSAKVEAIGQGRSYIKHIEGAAIAEQVQGGRFRASVDFGTVKQFDAVKEGVALFSGATILADGAPALIVDVASLLTSRNPHG